MAPPARLLVAPVPAVGRARLPAAAIAPLVAADAVRRARAEGRPTPTVGVYVEGGSLLAQHSAERVLAREGHDRASLGLPAFTARLREVESETKAAVDEVASLLDVALSWPATAFDPGSVGLAARTAFVRLFEEGLIEEGERVAPVCARCATVVTVADLEPAFHDTDRVTLRVVTDRGVSVEVDVFALEFLPGVVAVAVPAGHPLDGAKATVPLAGTVVPVFSDPSVAQPSLVIPAHDTRGWRLARVRGLLPEPVLDVAGVVRAPGPLYGLGRFAARAAARDRLAGAAAIVRVEPGEEPAPRCRECGTAVVFALGRHWVLAARPLTRAAADAVREGAVSFTPATARDDFLTVAGAGAEWIVSADTWGGVAVPAAVCEDCGSTAVEVGTSPSCRRCFGSLRADPRCLDARFVSACWLLAAAGWPHAEDGPWRTAADTAVIVPADTMRTFVVPAAALALRLSGAIAFSRVSVHDAGGAGTVADLRPGDRQPARLWLAGGAEDVDEARDLLDALDRVAAAGPEPADDHGPGPTDVAAAVAEALDELAVTAAAHAVRAALAAGPPSAAAARLRRVAAPITGG